MSNFNTLYERVMLEADIDSAEESKKVKSEFDDIVNNFANAMKKLKPKAKGLQNIVKKQNELLKKYMGKDMGWHEFVYKAVHPREVLDIDGSLSQYDHILGKQKTDLLPSSYERAKAPFNLKQIQQTNLALYQTKRYFNDIIDSYSNL